jgi:hypothetical protein
MKLNRQQVLLAILILIALIQAGDWLINSAIQGPLQERRAKTAQLLKDIRSREKQLAELRNAGNQINTWLQQSLPKDPEVARTAYRTWLLNLLRTTQLRDPVVDSGTPASRLLRNKSVLYRTLPFTLRTKGSLTQFNDFLFRFTNTGILHQITSFSLTPIGETALFDIAISIDTLLLADRKGNELNTKPSQLPASGNPADYTPIAANNLFGVGLNAPDPLKHTLLTAITYSNGKPLAWITDQLADRVTKVGPGENFTTAAMTGRVVEVQEQHVVLENASGQIRVPLGKSLAEAQPATAPQ